MEGLSMIPQNDKTAVYLILKGLTDAGCVVTGVEQDTWNPDDITPVDSFEQAVEAVMEVDEAVVFVTLPTGVEGWVFFVLGNEPIEVACNHTVNLSEFLDPITDPWWSTS